MRYKLMFFIMPFMLCMGVFYFPIYAQIGKKPVNSQYLNGNESESTAHEKSTKSETTAHEKGIEPDYIVYDEGIESAYAAQNEVSNPVYAAHGEDAESESTIHGEYSEADYIVYGEGVKEDDFYYERYKPEYASQYKDFLEYGHDGNASFELYVKIMDEDNEVYIPYSWFVDEDYASYTLYSGFLDEDNAVSEPFSIFDSESNRTLPVNSEEFDETEDENYTAFESNIEYDVNLNGESQITESAIPIGGGFRPFTPSGTGTVIDNATDGSKEFFTIITEDENVFYLIIDRHRANDNVYFLNGVTEQDLISLAQKNGKTVTGSTASVIPPTGQPNVNESCAHEVAQQNDSPKPKNNTGLFLIIIAVAGVGVAAYYFKVIKGKKNAPDDDIYDENGEGDEDEYGYKDEPEDDDNEKNGDEADERGE